VESRAKDLERKISALLDKQLKRMVSEVLGEIKRHGKPLKVRKALSKEQRALLKLFNHFGLLQALGGAGEVQGGRFRFRPLFEEKFHEENLVRVQELTVGIEADFRASVGGALSEWSKEEPRPPLREVARRIRLQAFLPHSEHTTEDQRVLQPLNRSTSRFGLAQRARTIARTETSRARNAGRFEAFVQLGFKSVQWSSFSDIHSRPGHAMMDDDERTIAGLVSGKEFFTNPKTGKNMKYPGDPAAPPGETINCRCTLVGVL
jgi:hypothetical protein